MEQENKKPMGWWKKPEFEWEGKKYKYGKEVDEEGNIIETEQKEQKEVKVEKPKAEKSDNKVENLEKQVQELQATLQKLVNGGGAKTTGNLTQKEFAEAIAQANLIQKGSEVYTPSFEYDEEDFLEKGVEFVTHGISYVIVDDKKNGRYVRTPLNNVIKFVLKSTKIVRNGRYNSSYTAFSSYISHSKKEVEWLRSHSQYNRKFFEKADDIKNVSALGIEAAYQVGKMLDSKDNAQIINLAKQHGVNVAQDINSIQKELHIVLTEKEVASMEARLKAKTQANLEAMYFGK